MAIAIYYANPAHDRVEADRAAYLSLPNARKKDVQVIAHENPVHGWSLEHGGGGISQVYIWPDSPEYTHPIAADLGTMLDYLAEHNTSGAAVSNGVLARDAAIGTLSLKTINDAGVFVGRSMDQLAWETLLITRVIPDCRLRWGPKTGWGLAEQSGLPRAAIDAATIS